MSIFDIVFMILVAIACVLYFGPLAYNFILSLFKGE